MNIPTRVLLIHAFNGYFSLPIQNEQACVSLLDVDIARDENWRECVNTETGAVVGIRQLDTGKTTRRCISQDGGSPKCSDQPEQEFLLAICKGTEKCRPYQPTKK
jgi:hypothetical protein